MEGSEPARFTPSFSPQTCPSSHSRANGLEMGQSSSQITQNYRPKWSRRNSNVLSPTAHFQAAHKSSANTTTSSPSHLQGSGVDSDRWTSRLLHSPSSHPSPRTLLQPADFRRTHQFNSVDDSTYTRQPREPPSQPVGPISPFAFQPLAPQPSPPPSFPTGTAAQESLTLPPRFDTPDTLPSYDPSPASRPLSRISWSSGDTSLFGSSYWPHSYALTGFVDLTSDSSPPTMTSTCKRKVPRAQGSREGSSGPAKRFKTSQEDAGVSKARDQGTKIEEVDLRDVDNDKDITDILENQRTAAINAQKEEADKPLRLSGMQCIICMETMTNITATHCGKFSSLS